MIKSEGFLWGKDQKETSFSLVQASLFGLQTGWEQSCSVGSLVEGFAGRGRAAAHTAVLNTRSSDSVNTHLELFIAIIKWEFS